MLLNAGVSYLERNKLVYTRNIIFYMHEMLIEIEVLINFVSLNMVASSATSYIHTDAY